jgi:hypothetical protein
MRRGLADLKALGAVLIDPVGATELAVHRSRPLQAALGLAVLLVGLGVATLPRQIALLDRSLAPVGDPMVDMPHAMMYDGLLRLIIADRIVASPALLLAALLLAYAAEPVLALARERRAAIWAVAILGLSPLVIDRIGELAVTYIVSVGAHPVPGDAIRAPHRFITGPLLAWWRDQPAPGWLELLDSRLNLIVAWSVALWAVGLRALDGERRFAAWHVLLPLACVAAGGVVTWVLGPLVLTALLGRP